MHGFQQRKRKETVWPVRREISSANWVFLWAEIFIFFKHNWGMQNILCMIQFSGMKRGDNMWQKRSGSPEGGKKLQINKVQLSDSGFTGTIEVQRRFTLSRDTVGNLMSFKEPLKGSNPTQPFLYHVSTGAFQPSHVAAAGWPSKAITSSSSSSSKKGRGWRHHSGPGPDPQFPKHF